MKQESGDKQKRYIWPILIVLLCVIFLTVRSFFISPVVIAGNSMAPGFLNGSIVYVWKSTVYSRGDVLLAEQDNGALMIKRLVGMPGDAIVMTWDSLYVNGVFIDSLPNSMEEDYCYSVIVQEGKLFLLGDNRMESNDCRHIGCVEQESIKGVVIAGESTHKAAKATEVLRP